MPHLAAPSALAVTMGEPAGIGAEITMKAWAKRNEAQLPPFLLIDDPDRIDALAQRSKLAAPVARISEPEEAVAVFPTALPVLPIALEGPVTPGHPNKATARAVVGAIDLAVEWALSGRIAGIVTNPIQKQVLYTVGFDYPGHTEYLAELSGEDVAPVMMLACPGLRVVPVTVHLSLRDAIAAIDRDTVVTQAMITWRALRDDFGIAAPRIAVAALNPHAGEGGNMGVEETGIIGPAIEILRDRGLDITGPLPADSMFHEAARATYDVAICMYHDQALIPLKTLNFEQGVNVTLGLPFVRTSPDHGTALSIAGTGTANPASLIAALNMASSIAHRRTAAAMPAVQV